MCSNQITLYWLLNKYLVPSIFKKLIMKWTIRQYRKLLVKSLLLPCPNIIFHLCCAYELYFLGKWCTMMMMIVVLKFASITILYAYLSRSFCGSWYAYHLVFPKVKFCCKLIQIWYIITLRQHFQQIFKGSVNLAL